MMLRPRDSNDQRLLNATLDIEPRPQSVRWIHDVFDNCVAIVNFAGNTRSLRVESNITLAHTPFEGPEVLLEDGARHYPFSYDGEEMPDLARSIERHYADPSGELDRWVQRFLRQGRPTETGTQSLESMDHPPRKSEERCANSSLIRSRRAPSQTSHAP